LGGPGQPRLYSETLSQNTKTKKPQNLKNQIEKQNKSIGSHKTFKINPLMGGALTSMYSTRFPMLEELGDQVWYPCPTLGGCIAAMSSVNNLQNFLFSSYEGAS
jgi:hypothetical protein